MDLRQAFDKSVSEHPEKTALIGEEQDYTYRELSREVRRTANFLESEGLNDEKIAFSAPNTAQTLITILGIWYSGSAAVHINPRLESEEIPYYLQDSEAESFIYHRSVSGKKETAEEELPSENIYELSDIRGDKVFSSDEDLTEELCSITYTSGTTGKPKGVPYRHTRLLHGSMILVIEAQESRDIPISIQDEMDQRAENSPERFSDRTIEKFIESEPWKDDVHAVVYPLYHVSGINPSFATLLGGGTLILPERDVDNIMSVFEEEEVTLSGAVPAQLNEMVDLTRTGNYDISSLNFLHTAGGLLTDETREKITNTLTENLCHEYASSETLEMAYSLDNSGALGEPTCLQEIKVVEPGTLKEVEKGEKGEAVINTDGPTVFQGYWNKPEKTAESMDNGWYRTGDLIRKEEDGRLWFEGRADDLIISGGENISPATVENAIVKHPNVEQVGVIGVEDHDWGQRVVAFVQGDFDEEELDQYLKESNLADFKRPKEYIKEEELPMKETSGVDRRRLQEFYED